MTQNFKTFLMGTAGGVCGALLVGVISNGNVFTSNGSSVFTTQSVISDGNGYSDGTNDEAGVAGAITCAKNNWSGPSSLPVGGTGSYTCNDKCEVNGTIIQGIADKIAATNNGVSILKNRKSPTQPGSQYAIIQGNLPGNQIVNCNFNCNGLDLSCPQTVKVDAPTCKIDQFTAQNPSIDPAIIDYNISNTNAGKAKLVCDLYKDGVLFTKDITAGGTKMAGALSNLNGGRYMVKCAYDLPGLVGCESADEYIVGATCSQVKIDGVAVDNSSYPIIYPLGKQVSVACVNNTLATIVPVLANQKPQGMTLIGNVTSAIHHISCPYKQGTKNLTCNVFVKGETTCGDGYVGVGEQCDPGVTGSCPSIKTCNPNSCVCEIHQIGGQEKQTNPNSEL